MIQHIVLLKLTPDTSAIQKTALLEGLVALKHENKILGIESVTGGDNNSPEGKTNGFDWGFSMTFTDAAARDAYLPLPDHITVGRDWFRPIVEELLVFDYEI